MPDKPCDPNTVSRDEMRALFREFPGPDLEAGTQAATREAQLTKPRGALGRLEELAAWLATWQGRHPARLQHPRTAVRSEEHTSELQSLMRISYAVFCLKKKKQKTQNIIDNTSQTYQHTLT